MLSQPLRHALPAPHNWLVLVLLMLLGRAGRLFFVQRHKGAAALGDRGAPRARWSPWLAWLVAPAPQAAQRPRRRPASPTCRPWCSSAARMCHNAQLAQKGVRLDTPDAARAARRGDPPAGGGHAPDAAEQRDPDHGAGAVAARPAGSRPGSARLSRAPTLLRRCPRGLLLRPAEPDPRKASVYRERFALSGTTARTPLIRGVKPPVLVPLTA